LGKGGGAEMGCGQEVHSRKDTCAAVGRVARGAVRCGGTWVLAYTKAWALACTKASAWAYAKAWAWAKSVHAGARDWAKSRPGLERESLDDHGLRPHHDLRPGPAQYRLARPAQQTWRMGLWGDGGTSVDGVDELEVGYQGLGFCLYQGLGLGPTRLAGSRGARDWAKSRPGLERGSLDEAGPVHGRAGGRLGGGGGLEPTEAPGAPGF
jgi:hypothetical protein